MDNKKRFDKINNTIGTTAETSLLFYRAAIGAGATEGEATRLLQAYIGAMAFGKGQQARQKGQLQWGLPVDLQAWRSGGVPPGVERQVPGMPIEELLDLFTEREVEIYTRYDFISDSLIVKMRKKGLETEEIIPRKEAVSKGFGLTIRVILRGMADRLGKEAEHDN